MVFMTQISSYRHINIRQDFANQVMQAITESNHSGPGAVRAYERIPRQTSGLGPAPLSPRTDRLKLR